LLKRELAIMPTEAVGLEAGTEMEIGTVVVGRVRSVPTSDEKILTGAA
jgi:hypothetical protein